MAAQDRNSLMQRLRRPESILPQSLHAFPPAPKDDAAVSTDGSADAKTDSMIANGASTTKSGKLPDRQDDAQETKSGKLSPQPSSLSRVQRIDMFAH